MQPRTLIGRLLSPAGFGLVLILFLTPFLTVSCDAAGATTVDSTFTGIDLVVGGAPDMSGPNVTPDVESQLAQALDDQGDLDLDVLALLSAIAVMAGMGCALLRDRLARHGGAAGLAAVAGALIVAAVLRVPGRVAAATEQLFGGSDVKVTTSMHTRVGLWLAVIALAVLVVGNTLALARAWRQADPVVAPEPPPDPDARPAPSSLDGMWDER